ncbi:pyridoxal phosphate-dependent decarboxylase family protein [Allomuricauda sp. F6463D]|uniref:pyridoxal phosphate-dependent decarboxylase family protein n=1 Tax=Allomuricauda sp. F6463D TaxID=2926409 RepID=UPI001FF4D054|nr:aminotransferase class V-fold PLP-dependent enzyme [Muricauda sp. F6463D]MCK0159106.1 aminotransferase class V-fold PLP-dependent enzyme [Muricauda sp. F6463D]
MNNNTTKDSNYPQDLILEETKEQREFMEKIVLDFGHKFIHNLEQDKVYHGHPDVHGDQLHEFEIDAHTQSLEELLDTFDRNVLKTGLNPASGGHLGYIPGGGLYSSALGDFLAALTNRYAGVFYASPGAVKMENALIKWAGELIGYDQGFGGNLTSGGSIANLIALTCARHHGKTLFNEMSKSIIYCSPQAHHSIFKAIQIIGMDSYAIHKIPLDNAFKLSVAHLEQQIEVDLKAGLNPFLVIANAGSTDVGAIDPIEQVSAICKKHSIWFHVDAAYGGFFALTKTGRDKLKGLQHADSIILDPHKGLFLPYGSGIVLVKKLKHLTNTFKFDASYMQDSYKMDRISPADMSPELSKHFRGLRMWLPLKLYGPQAFANYLDEKLVLTSYLYTALLKLNFHVVCEPELTVVAFRYEANIHELGEINRINKFILKTLLDDGRIFLSSTMIDDKFTLRAALLSFRTHKNHIDLLLDLLANSLDTYSKRS